MNPLNQTQLAKVLGYSKASISRWEGEGRIVPEYGRGKTARYDTEKVKKQITAHEERKGAALQKALG